MTNSLTTYLNFLWAGLVKHGQTGGVVPSQRFLIAKMIAPVPEAYRGQVIELGAGTGALTLRLAARCPEAKILACEINPALARDWAKIKKCGGNYCEGVIEQGHEQLLRGIGSSTRQQLRDVGPADG
jgi:phospholipid N-methyltransferase